MTQHSNDSERRQDVVTHLVLLVPGTGPVTVQQMECGDVHVERRDVVLFYRDRQRRLSLLAPEDVSAVYDGSGVLTVTDEAGDRFVFPPGAWPGIRFKVSEARSTWPHGNGSGGGR